HIRHTLERLERRIAERFPGSGLRRVAGDLRGIAEETESVLQRARRPHWPIRLAVYAALAAIGALVVALVIIVRTQLSVEVAGVGDLLQSIESAAQDLIFFGLAVYFLLTIETRHKRKAALRELHRLRSIVHIVDMHQLTKDPEHLLSPEQVTPSSPSHRLGRFKLARYLDYCTELLSLSSKLAALHVQHVNDPVVLNAVNDVEVLASNLSNKIWQKIVIVDTAAGREAGSHARRQSEALTDSMDA
ncbi:MAG: hypothetical protein ABFS34_07650, partial [Gemmatimonadota bacterium]